MGKAQVSAARARHRESSKSLMDLISTEMYVDVENLSDKTSPKSLGNSWT